MIFNPQFLLGIFFTLILGLNSLAQAYIPWNKVFQTGEKVEYHVQYQWGFMWVDAGRVVFKIDSSQYNQKPSITFSGTGKTLEKWDWMYKVRDSYTSISDTGKALAPLYFERKVEEGSTFIHNRYYFLGNSENARFDKIERSGKITSSQIKVSGSTSDVMSMIYRARLMPFQNFDAGQKIPINLLLDGKMHQTHIEYLGIERIKIRGKGYIQCYKFKPLLIDGTIFKAGDEMMVWVSQDRNRVPILVETPILVGSIKAVISNAENLLYPLNFDSTE